MQKCNSNLEELAELAEKLLEISNQGDMDRDDSSCGVLYGVTRDSAFKILEGARREIEKHKENGKWE